METRRITCFYASYHRAPHTDFFKTVRILQASLQYQAHSALTMKKNHKAAGADGSVLRTAVNFLPGVDIQPIGIA